MVDGQIGWLEIVHCLVLKGELEVVIILYHLVDETVAVVLQ